MNTRRVIEKLEPSQVDAFVLDFLADLPEDQLEAEGRSLIYDLAAVDIDLITEELYEKVAERYDAQKVFGVAKSPTDYLRRSVAEGYLKSLFFQTPTIIDGFDDDFFSFELSVRMTARIFTDFWSFYDKNVDLLPSLAAQSLKDDMNSLSSLVTEGFAPAAMEFLPEMTVEVVDLLQSFCTQELPSQLKEAASHSLVRKRRRRI